MKKWIIGAIAAVAALGLLAAYNAVVAVPVASALKNDPDVTLVAYRHWLVSPDEIVLDVWGAKDTASMVLMDRALFDAAEALKAQRFKTVILAWRGRTRFRMEGPYFQQVGEERQWQNPIYTMRTMQEHVARPDGSRAFDTFEGGWLGVFIQQARQHSELHYRWWILSVAGRDPDGPLPPEAAPQRP